MAGHATACRPAFSRPSLASRQVTPGTERRDGFGGTGGIIFRRRLVGFAGSWEDRGPNSRRHQYLGVTSSDNGAASALGGVSISRGFRQSDESVETRFRHNASRSSPRQQVRSAAEDHPAPSLVFVHWKHGGH